MNWSWLVLVLVPKYRVVFVDRLVVVVLLRDSLEADNVVAVAVEIEAGVVEDSDDILFVRACIDNQAGIGIHMHHEVAAGVDADVHTAATRLYCNCICSHSHWRWVIL